MKLPMRTCVSVEVQEVAVNSDGQLYAILELKWKQLGYEKPNRSTKIFVDLSKAIKRENNS